MANTTILQLPTTVTLNANAWFEIDDAGSSKKANTTQIITGLTALLPNSFGNVTISGGKSVVANATANVLILLGTGGVVLTPNSNTNQINVDTTVVFAAANAAQTEAVAAYGQANTGIAQTAVAFAYANGVGTNLTTAWGIANTGYTQANVGIAQVAVAFAYANGAIQNTGGTMTGTLNLGPLTTSQGIFENVNFTSAAVPAIVNVDVLVSGVVYYSANLSANITVNFRGNTSQNLNGIMATGKSMTTALVLRNGSGAANTFIPSAYQVDAVSVTPLWVSASALPLGSGNQISSYSYSLLKTASNTYTILASQTQYA